MLLRVLGLSRVQAGWAQYLSLERSCTVRTEDETLAFVQSCLSNTVQIHTPILQSFLFKWRGYLDLQGFCIQRRHYRGSKKFWAVARAPDPTWSQNSPCSMHTRILPSPRAFLLLWIVTSISCNHYLNVKKHIMVLAL